MHEQEANELTGRRRELLEVLPGLRRFAMSLTGNGAAADDLLYATVERVLKRGLPVEAELLPWCVRVCRHLWAESALAKPLQQAAGSDCNRTTPSRAAARVGDAAASWRGDMQAALAGLSGDQRAVLELVAVEGHSYRATAAMLDMPIGRVMGWLARARGMLIEQCPVRSPAPLGRQAVP